MDELREFYAAIGIEFQREQHGDGPVHFAGNVGDVVLEIYPLSDADESPYTAIRLGFVVDDLEGVLNALVEQQLSSRKTIKETPWGRRAVVRDPDGRAVELVQQS